MKYRIAIPSYQREELIQKKTLQYLADCNIDPSCIDIFVANEDEYKIYKNALPKDVYDELIIGELGYNNVKNFMAEYYPKNAPIVHFDDDVNRLMRLNHKNGKDVLENFYDLDKLIRFGFKMMDKYGSSLLGFSPVNTTLYMDNSISQGLYFCIGNFYLQYNKRKFKLRYPDYADFELCLKTYLIDNKVLRLNNIVAITQYGSNEGGTETYRTSKMQKKISEELINKYPQYIKYNPKTYNPYEVRFIRQKDNTKVKL